MIQLSDFVARGGWLFDASGGVYTLGDSPFYGSFIDQMKVDEFILSSSQYKSSGYSAVTNLGNLLIAGENKLSKNILTTSESNLEFTRGIISGSEIALFDGDNSIYIKKLPDVLHDEYGSKVFTLSEVDRVPVCSLAFANNGEGLFVLLESGKILTFGNAQHLGDFISENIQARAVSIAIKPWGTGYWVIDSIGGVFCFGDSDYFGSIPGDGMTIESLKIISHPSGRGYYIIDSFGHVFPFGYGDTFKMDMPDSIKDLITFVPEIVEAKNEQLYGAKNITQFLYEEIKNKKELENNEN